MPTLPAVPRVGMLPHPASMLAAPNDHPISRKLAKNGSRRVIPPQSAFDKELLAKSMLFAEIIVGHARDSQW